MFGNKSLVFPLQNKEGRIVSFYFRAIEDKEVAHLYLQDRQGLYPGYPQENTKVLLLTESIIDCASLIQSLNKLEVRSTNLEKLPTLDFKNLTYLACYGVNGFTEEHREAINELKKLEEIIIMFDSDESGRKGAEKLGIEILELRKESSIKK
ncbi:toprim domain-containing protein [Apibacter adventoris]|uniref:toprim domain-containing protein n=1 Tax=Apibacter adventoris TaxID=1679466 RepID=UPI0015E28D19|nr:toprim domain-containing protein [Apibacter adventoris]